MALPVDYESDDYKFNKTLNCDLQLIPDQYNQWDLNFRRGDLVNVTGHDSLRNGIILAIMTRFQELYRNKLYSDFGCRIHELIKSNKSNMVRYKIEQFIVTVVSNMRRVNKINEITVTENGNHGYLVYFEVVSVNDELVKGEFVL